MASAHPYAVPRLARLSLLPAGPNPFVGSTGDPTSGSGVKRLRLRLKDGTAVFELGAGDPSCAIAGASGSFFSTDNAILDPPRTPPSHDRKQARTEPDTRIVLANSVGRR